MRTAIIILIGLGLWAVCVGAAKLLSGSNSSSVTTATAAFIAVWFLAAAVNMWVGVTRAGYSFREELPIFLVIFLLPVAVSVVAKWKFL
jgi:hypothetical protein